MKKFDNEKAKEIFKRTGITLCIVLFALWFLHELGVPTVGEIIVKKRLEKLYNCKLDDASFKRCTVSEESPIEIFGGDITSGLYYTFAAKSGEEIYRGTLDAWLRPIATYNEFERYADDIADDVGKRIEAAINSDKYAINLVFFPDEQIKIIDSYDEFLKREFYKLQAELQIYLPKETTNEDITKINLALMKYYSIDVYKYYFIDDTDFDFVRDNGPMFSLAVYDKYEYHNKYAYTPYYVSEYQYNKQNGSLKDKYGDIDFVLDYGTDNEQIVLDGYNSLAGYCDYRIERDYDDDNKYLIFSFEDDYAKEVDEIVANRLNHDISIVKDGRCLYKSRIIPSPESGTILVENDDFEQLALDLIFNYSYVDDEQPTIAVERSKPNLENYENIKELYFSDENNEFTELIKQTYGSDLPVATITFDLDRDGIEEAIAIRGSTATPLVYLRRYGWEIKDCFFIDDSRNIKECPLHLQDEESAFAEYSVVSKYAQIYDYEDKSVLLMSSNCDVTLGYVLENDELVQLPEIDSTAYMSFNEEGEVIILHPYYNEYEDAWTDDYTGYIDYPAYFDGDKICLYNAREITSDAVHELGELDFKIIKDCVEEKIKKIQFIYRENNWLYANVLTEDNDVCCIWFKLVDKKWEKIDWTYQCSDFVPGANDNRKWLGY